MSKHTYADSTLKSWTKDELIHQIRILEHNVAVGDERLNNQAKLLEAWAPVVHGKWYYNENGRDFGLGAWACSCCDTCNHNIPGNPNINPYIWSGSKFCPNCGAKMDGGDTDEH